MTSRLKRELLQLQLQRKNKNDNGLFLEEATVNLRKLWTAAYAEAAVPKGTRLFYSVRHNFGTEIANEGMLIFSTAGARPSDAQLPHMSNSDPHR